MSLVCVESVCPWHLLAALAFLEWDQFHSASSQAELWAWKRSRSLYCGGAGCVGTFPPGLLLTQQQQGNGTSFLSALW